MIIGFIGLGNMGRGMAANLIKGGYYLSVYDIHKESIESLVKSGATPVNSPKEAASASDIVFTSLPGPREVESVAMGSEGIIHGIHPGMIYIDLSTSSPSLIRRIYQVFKEKGVAVMDAPVSGGPEGARTGKLTFMVGGDETVFNSCKPILEKMGDKVTYTGGIGCGSICKLMHNCISTGLNAITAECLTLGVKAGVEPRVLWQAIRNGAVGRGLTFTMLLPKVYLRGGFDKPSMSLNIAFKDQELATSLGREFHVPMPIADSVWQDYVTAVNRGWGDKDGCAAMLIQEERAGGIEVRIPDIEVE
jgi:3-hydroxyisobutyrate dehydrogenase